MRLSVISFNTKKKNLVWISYIRQVANFEHIEDKNVATCLLYEIVKQ